MVDSGPFRMVARAGFAVSGVLSAIVGLLALSIAFGGSGGEQASQTGALQRLASAPGGAVLIWGAAIALLALGLWQAVQILTPSGGEPKERTKDRVRHAGLAIGYLAVGGIALQIALGSGGGGGGAQDVSAAILSMPGGQVILTIVGAGIGAVGVYFIVKGVARTFLETDIVAPSGAMGTAATATGVAGYTGRGLAIAILGVLWIVGAVTADPDQATGLDGELARLAQLPFGAVLLTVIALGFLVYGVYCGFRARYARL